MDDRELLRAIYRALQWEELCRLAPGVSRERVDELFRRLSAALPPAGAGPAGPAGESERATLHCDGASRGNPGPAAIGMVLRAPDGRTLQAWGARIGTATNNAAEYRALIAGLEEALQLGVKEIEVASDSELLVRQLSGRYRVRNPGLAALHARAMELLGRFRAWQARHVQREENAEADRLARAQLRNSRRPPG